MSVEQHERERVSSVTVLRARSGDSTVSMGRGNIHNGRPGLQGGGGGQSA